MKKKTAKLALVETQISDEQQAKRNEEIEQQKEAHKITRAEIANRVHDIRQHLETVKMRFEGALFDVVTPEMPRSLDFGEQRELDEMVKSLNPEIKIFV